MNLRDVILQITDNTALYDYLGNFEALNDSLKVELEDQKYLEVVEVYLLPENITILRAS